MPIKQKKPKLTKYLSPEGTAVFPYLNQPDRGEYCKQPEFGDWKTGLRLDLSKAEVKAFIESLEKAYQNAIGIAEAEEDPRSRAQREADGKTLGATRSWKPEFDDAGKPTGFAIVNFKRAGGGRDKNDNDRVWHNSVDLFDAKNNRIDRSKVRIGGGSRIIVCYGIKPFSTKIGTGISLVLLSVQVIQRMDMPEVAAEQYGFAPREDGFSVDTTADDSGDSEGPASTDGGDEGDDV